MRVPVPTSRLVAFTLAGALLTAVVAGGLAFPGLGLAADSSGDAPGGTGGTQQVAADAPEPNQNFTPATQTQSGYEEDEYEDHDEDDEYEGEDHDEDEEDDAEAEYEEEAHDEDEEDDAEAEYEEEAHDEDEEDDEDEAPDEHDAED